MIASLPKNWEVVVRRRICLVGAALSVCPLAFVAGTATAASSTSKSSQRVLCSTKTSVMVANGEMSVQPPASQGDEYGTASCGKLLGSGVQRDSFTVPASGDTIARFELYFPTGTVHGTYDLTPQAGSFNFLETDWTGKMKVLGGTGAYKGATGTGTMACKTLDGVHTTCTDRLKLKGA
jgi:hypothetical protein